MRKFKVKARFVSNYLQNRKSEEVQKKLICRAGTKSKLPVDDSWKNAGHKNEKEGYFIPALQLEASFAKAGSKIKQKPYGNFKEKVKASFLVTPDEIYLDKKEPDFINESYVSRKDGLMVKTIKPAFSAGIEFEFYLEVLDDDLDIDTIQLIVVNSGKNHGIGSWRPKHGRYEILEFSIVE